MSTTMNPIEQVRERLDGGRKWCKRSLADDDGSFCLIGAAVRQQPLLVVRSVPLIVAVVQEQYPDRVAWFAVGGGVVSSFNDHPDTTWADVDAVLDKASVLWDERSGGAS
jgi:hypothetical protein